MMGFCVYGKDNFMGSGVYKHKKIHGMYGTKTYCSWASMKQRCLNKKCNEYKDYGGRGITICREWMKFENFYEDMGERLEGKTLDRIDNNGNYEPNNCKWSTPKEQNNNNRHNRYMSFRGEIKTMKQWSTQVNISYKIISWRMLNGWGTKRALTEKPGSYFNYQGNRKRGSLVSLHSSSEVK